MSPLRRILSLLLALILPAAAQEKKDQPGPRTEGEILKSVKLPEGYTATVFANAPELGYPTSVSAAIDGTIFVSVDENGSLGRDRNAAPELGVAGPKDGRTPGRIVRMRDIDGDGRADEFKTFATVESPRGVIWDGPGFDKTTGKMSGKLYVMAPPRLISCHDADGDGTADTEEDILKGLGFGLDFRGADHTTNGARLAIDGFIYIAVGDYGFTKAVAKDGTTLSMRGGGIVRIRPDGTGFEIVSRGQRNIYDVAVSPTLDLFTRDNTNDGGGWNVRLSHVPPGAQMGYPTLFINFPEDIVPALADLGGGSPCGALWLDEPGLPQGLFTVEWGRNAIMYHKLTPNGAGWKHEGQTEWLKMVRPTDMDVDATGALYITSWEGATFNYNGPNAGYVLRVVKKDVPKVAVVNLRKMNASDLMMLVASPSASLRLAAQREMIQRNEKPRDAYRDAITLGAGLLIEGGIRQGQVGSAYAAHWLYILACRDPQAATPLEEFKRRPADWRLLELRVRGDSLFQPKGNEVVIAALGDSDSRVRAGAVTALRRLGKADPAPSILPLVADTDPIVAHLAVGALREWHAAKVCLAALDAADDRVKPGALQALYGIPTSEVVDGLIARLEKGSAGFQPAAVGILPAPVATNAAQTSGKMPEGAGRMPAVPNSFANADGSFNLRRGVLNALCRLANVDAPYADPKEWWGTRPDTSGPVYKPVPWAETEKIQAALKRELDAATGEDARWLVQRMYLCKVNTPGLVEQMLAACGNDTPARLKAIEGLFRHDNSLPPEGIKALGEIAANEAETPALRARALRFFQRASERSAALEAAIAAFAPFAGQTIGQPAISAAFEDFTRDSKQTKNLTALTKLAESGDAQKRTLAQTILVNLATSTLVKGKDKENAEKAVAKSWEKPETAASLLAVIARTKAKAYAAQVDARLKDPNNAVAEAALFAHQALDLGGPAQKQIAGMKYEEVFAAVQKGGDAAQGEEIYLRSGCIACHTIGADEPPKGPILSAVAKMYDRAALTESILKPNAKLAQGFESTWIKTKKGEQLEGFVTREGGDNLDLRNVAGQTVLLEKADIAERGHREVSMMPEGLMNAFTAAELANLLAYLESLKK